MPVDVRAYPAQVVRLVSAFLSSNATPLALVLLFFGIASHDLALPGLYGDEAIDIVPALQIVGQYSEHLYNGQAGTHIALGDKQIPLMLMRYTGALKLLLFVPVAAIFGESISSVRLFTLTIAAVAVLATYRFTSLVFSRRAAALATLLLALDQSFILRTKVDWGPNAIAIACKMLALVALACWWRSSRQVLLGADSPSDWGCTTKPTSPGCSPR